MFFNGEPWCTGNDVASTLGDARPNNAIRDHVPEKIKKRSYDKSDQ